MPPQTTSRDPDSMERLSTGGKGVCRGVVAGMPARIIWEHDPKLLCGQETKGKERKYWPWSLLWHNEYLDISPNHSIFHHDDYLESSPEADINL